MGQKIGFSPCRYLEMGVKWAEMYPQLMELFSIMQIEALLSYSTGIVCKCVLVCVCVCLLLFTCDYYTCKTCVVLVCGWRLLCKFESSIFTLQYQQDNHGCCRGNALLSCKWRCCVWMRGPVSKLQACSWTRCCQNDGYFSLIKWNRWYDTVNRMLFFV